MARRTRVAEVLSALSLTTDLGSGMPFEKGLRTCVAASAARPELSLGVVGRQPRPTPRRRHYVDTTKHIAVFAGEDTSVHN